MKYDIIALDVDGTLLDDHHRLTPGTREAVREAAQRGAEIVLCTGRGPSNSIPVLEELGLGGTIITHNGAATVDVTKREAIHQFSFGTAEIAPFMEYCRTRQIHFDVNTAFELYVDSMTETVQQMYHQFRITPIVWSDGAGLPEKLVKMTIFGEKQEMDEIQKDWESFSKDRFPNLSWIRSGDVFIDVQHAEANKGQALAELAKQRGIAPERVMAIGNYYNDIGMLTFAGLGIAMANSPEAVKLAAGTITSSNEEEGVRAALLKYCLA
ncbi:HAD family phosphatase [Paenibacillaceae bacterium]|nr:HAD family phosphatase [Paenibacillaceae bacterium]